MGNEGSGVGIKSVSDMTKSSDVVVARLRDKIYVFLESNGFVKGDAKNLMLSARVTVESATLTLETHVRVLLRWCVLRRIVSDYSGFRASQF